MSSAHLNDPTVMKILAANSQKGITGIEDVASILFPGGKQEKGKGTGNSKEVEAEEWEDEEEEEWDDVDAEEEQKSANSAEEKKITAEIEEIWKDIAEEVE